MKKSLTGRVPLLVTMLTAALIVVGWGVASAGPCIPDGQTCRTNESCCAGVCVKPSKKSFGTCCTPTTCAAEGANCGMIADGCGGTLNCGTCTLPETCGGGGTPNVCGTTIQCCVQSSPMGAFDTCTVETPVQCHAQGGIAQGSGTCSPSPCPVSCVPTGLGFPCDPASSVCCPVPHASVFCAASFTCHLGLCDPGFQNCNLTAADGCEVDLNTDSSNCGSCGHICPSGTSCTSGTCQ